MNFKLKDFSADYPDHADFENLRNRYNLRKSYYGMDVNPIVGVAEGSKFGAGVA